MDTTQSAVFRAQLESDRARFAAEVGEAIVAPEQMTYGSQAASASQVFEQQRDLALRDLAVHHLEQVDAALARLTAGTFGRCLRCGRQVASGLYFYRLTTAEGRGVRRMLLVR